MSPVATPQHRTNVRRHDRWREPVFFVISVFDADENRKFARPLVKQAKD